MIDVMKKFNNDNDMMYNYIISKYIYVLSIFDSFSLFRGDLPEDTVNTKHYLYCNKNVDEFCQRNIITDGNYIITDISIRNGCNTFAMILTNATYLIILYDDELSLCVNVNTLDEKVDEIMAKKNMLSAPKYCVC